ncbi:hypothetical protein [Synechococcus sp. PCC 7335]|uniref:hypothetical protein n=1 Tax=Synechococcus sp. (strain ATCC 29403 / PCC 7335) TaxID=91464 RepID=UPI0005700D33|nr:hypothetical protein [Synechococcus sp. PCC 7335]
MTGIVSHIEKQTKTAGYFGGYARAGIRTTFRLNGRPIYYRGSPQVSNGDSVRVIGFNDKGILKAKILYNHTIGIRYGSVFGLGMRLNYFLGAGCISLGVLSIWSIYLLHLENLEIANPAARHDISFYAYPFIGFVIWLGISIIVRRFRSDRAVLRLMREAA